MELAFIVTTLGRIEALERLVTSIQGQLATGDSLVVVAQGAEEAVEATVAPLRRGPGTIIVTSSERGASRGRNAGVAALPSTGDPLLVFPNDTTWFPDGAVSALRALGDDVRLGAATIVDENGPKFTLPPAGTPLNRRTVWSVIEMGLLMRRREFEELGGFDVTIGTGAHNPWQAGEATDLLLRFAGRFPDTKMHWLPPEVAFGGRGNSQGLSDAERRRKLRGYGRGLGRLVSVWKWPLWWRVAFVGAGALVGVRYPRDFRLADGWWGMLGRAEGVVGRTVGTAPSSAVTR